MYEKQVIMLVRCNYSENENNTTIIKIFKTMNLPSGRDISAWRV